VIDGKSVFISIPVLHIGGTEMQTLNLVRVLLNADYNVTVCCYYEFDSSMVAQMKNTGAEVLLMRLKRADGILSLIIKLVKKMSELKPDIVHVQYIAPGLIPVIAAKLAGIKTVFATVHQPGRVYGWKEKTLLRIAARLSTAFFCNSKAVEESWFGDSEIYNPEKNYQGRKHFTIYNGLDAGNIEKIAKSADREEIKELLNISDKKVIGVVGRLRSEKGHALLLNAMVDVIKVIPGSVLLVIGDGTERAHLEEIAKKLGMHGNVIWLGQKDQNEVFQLHGIMDVVAIPSLFEGFGLTAAEAMAAGRPAVCARVDGLTEIVEEGVTGYAVPVNDSGELASYLILLLNNPAKANAMGLQGHQRVKEMFSLERFSEATIAVYQYFSRRT
jgi:L-malate glycosyltransferase